MSRREVLTSIGAAGLGALTVGTGSAAAETSEYNVGTASPASEQAARGAADKVIRVLDWGSGEKTVTGTFTDEAVDKLAKRPDVRYTEINGEMHAIGQTLEWGVDRVDAEKVHADGETGGDNTDGEGGADIAIIDTGIDSDHPDLQANLGTGYAVVSSRGPYAEKWDDDNGHGTHCAGIADALDNNEGVVGVSTAATLHAVKVLDNGGSGSFSDVAEGIRWVADRGYDVGSMSLGASSGSQTVKDACTYAYGEGVLLVAAAGNSGPCTDCVGYPAAYSEVVAVSATNESDALAGYSSTGPEVELAAPGTEIYSTYAGGGYDTLSGTSMACPHVSGAGGQLMDNGYTNTEARDQLNSTAEDIGLSSNEQGNGLLDVAAALGLDSSDDLGGSNSSPTVDSLSATNVTDSSATLNGDLTDLGGESSADCYFEWRESGTSSWNTTATQTLTSTGTFSEDISGLSSGTKYEFRAVAEASDGDTDTGETLTFTTDSGGSGNAPTVDSLSLSEDNSGGSPHADFDASWSVSDSDGDLDTVDLTLTDTDTGATEDSASVDVSGSDASGTTDLKAKFDENNEHTYEVKCVVTDSNNNTASHTATEVEDGS